MITLLNRLWYDTQGVLNMINKYFNNFFIIEPLAETMNFFQK